MADYQLTVALYMSFLYSNDGLHFKHNIIPRKMTCALVSVQGCPLNIGQNNKERQTGLLQGFWPLNRGVHLIQVTNTVFV